MGSWRCIKRLIILLVTGTALFFCTSSALVTAQSAQKAQLALGVSPAITELVLEPGRPKKLTVTVTNIADVALPVKASSAGLQPQEEVADEDRAPLDASKWIQAAEPEFILHPRQQKAIDIIVTPPANAEPGGHYATIFFQPLVPAEAAKNNAALIGSKVGVLALLIVKGDIREAASLDLDAPLFSEHGPAELSLHIKNSGNVHFMPAGSVEIRDVRGDFVDTVPLPPTLVLPKTTKTIAIKWNNKKRTGYFSAQASVKYGAPQTSLISETRSLWIFPGLKLAVLLVLAGVAGLIFWRTRGRRRRALAALFGRAGQDKSKPQSD